MIYKIRLTKTARHDLRQLPPAIRNRTLQHLTSGLANYVTLLSQPSSSPFPLDCQVSFFDLDEAPSHWQIATYFQFSQDETAIVVLAVHENHEDSSTAL